ncbi:glucose-6-phosphate isomerase family protein [Nissabacter sp. SGAir0207]|uniref:glucose-6-phosphate isomerase family protein n=1 Tax=Nissabacter sp. SGAir0207 TaxID=2126321 RepID=UPI0010CCCE12|nr:glucose-6-phosphate isomerase family protein [Nissabacter sp. SGAir0207]QCR37202.1 glucose-6-phosphate isomerase [Nissabacter sp. SGAir0207]
METRYGLEMAIRHDPLGFSYGEEVIGPMPEIRTLAQMRSLLRDPGCDGPAQVYATATDVARLDDRAELERRMLRFCVVACAAGTLGAEPVHSQGHVHPISQHSGWSPPELIEIWQGRAMVYMQEYVAEDAGRCFAVQAGPGEKVLVPPGWAHAILSATPDAPLAFATCCDRERRADHGALCARHGLAWYPLVQGTHIVWQRNPHYAPGQLQVITPRRYHEFGLTDAPLYQQFRDDPARLQFISRPGRVAAQWRRFLP